MPAVWDLIRDEHNEVTNLFAQFSEADNGQRPTIFNDIKQVLTFHAQLEEKLVYPVLTELDKEMAEHAQKEHGVDLTQAKTLARYAQSLIRDE